MTDPNSPSDPVQDVASNSNATTSAKESAYISMKDQKLLWSRSAGLCAFSDCRVKLSDHEGTTTYGNMCHIVAESDAGPRGNSPLTAKERNSYPNLILLCSHHHDVIDKLPQGPRLYPIEVLHNIKAKHEIYVDTSLAQSSDAADLVYARIVDDIVEAMQLAHWAWLSDNAVRDLLPFVASEGADHLATRLLQISWPNKHVLLDEAARRTMEAFVAFVEHFSSLAERTESGNFLKADASYKRRGWNPNYEYFEKRRNIWSQLNCAYLGRTVIALNEFSALVRENLNPRFFAEQGRFLVHDSMEVRGRGGAFLPEIGWVQSEIDEWERELAGLGKPPVARIAVVDK